MSALILMLIGLAMIVAGYLFYSKHLASRVFRLDDEFVTPAHELRDGVDYVPTNKFVLWGHHFTSVAGAAPIVGPAIAVIWGWLPAFLWVTLGTVFFAGMHDMGALWASQRNNGRSMGALSGRYIGGRGAKLFLVVIFLLLLMVVAAFAVVIKNLLIGTPSAVIPAWGAILVALVVGQAVYRWKMNLGVVTVVGVAALYGLILLGDKFPVVLPDPILGMAPGTFWIIALFLYAGVASFLPVWVLLQPRDYINGVQLFVGLGLPASLSATILATMAVLFAATTMDTGVRLLRFVVQEGGEVAGIRIGKLAGTVIVTVVAVGLTFSQGVDGSGGLLIWPLFGTTNQLLASLTLAIIAVMLIRKRRNPMPALIPLVLVFVMAFYAAIKQLGTFSDSGDWMLLVLDVIIIAAVWVAAEAVLAMRRASKEPPEAPDADLVDVGLGKR